MIPAHKGDDRGREWRPGYVGWYHRLSQQYLWKSDSTWMIPVCIQGRWREQKLNVVMPVGDALSGSAHWTQARSPFLLPPLTLHSLEQSTNGIRYDQDLLEQSADRDRLFTQSSIWIPGHICIRFSVSPLFTTWFTTWSCLNKIIELTTHHHSDLDACMTHSLE